MKKSTSVLAGLAVAASTVLVAAPAAHAASPTITVSPTKNVKNGATLTLKVSGFKPGSSLAAVQCKVAKPGPGGAGCNVAAVVMFTADSKGKATAKLKVLKAQGNYVGAGSVDQTQQSKAVKISFKK
jgi:hypothetical protein